MDSKTVALSAAKKAGAYLLDVSKGDIKFEAKSKYDILAEADLGSEKIIMDEIKSVYPDHNILSEELGNENKKSDYLWVLDPVDGTINFSRKVDEFCISIGLEHKGEIILGLIYNPTLDRLFFAEKGKGAFLNDKKIHVSDETELINTLLATDNSDDPQLRRKNFDVFSQMSVFVRHVRIFGSGALHLARLAVGQIDVYFQSKFNYWDYAAGTLIIQEAGGKVTDFDGNPISIESKSIVASNGKCHAELLEKLQQFL